jgi:hypothetical protein
MLGLDYYLNDSPYAANLDPERLGAAGASYGGRTQAETNERGRGGVMQPRWVGLSAHWLTPCVTGSRSFL